MNYLIKRKPTTSREELVAHWFANHMPGVIESQTSRAEQGKLAANRYVATLFDAGRKGAYPWDGIAQLWWDRALPRPEELMGTTPMDSFQQKAEPYAQWATTEYVIMDPSERLGLEPLTLNPPFPCTRSGFFKVIFLVGTVEGTDYDAFFDHWLDAHVTNVRNVMNEVGGFGYAVSHSIEPEVEPHTGMAELYFDNVDQWVKYNEIIKPDGMERWVDMSGTLILTAQTEMIGIP